MYYERYDLGIDKSTVRSNHFLFFKTFLLKIRIHFNIYASNYHEQKNFELIKIFSKTKSIQKKSITRIYLQKKKKYYRKIFQIVYSIEIKQILKGIDKYEK